jgi:hypothetical protein
MGFFKKLFEKKECSICGGEIGLLGNRKLEDGNMCKVCAGKLSPWFSDRRNSTVDQINEQLVYREENQKKLENFQVAYSVGEYYKLFVEEENGVPVRFFVSSYDDYMEENPDILSFQDVISCVTDVESHRTELKQRNTEGEMVSYNPPKFEYSYDFTVDMAIRNNPYFNDISFKLNSSSVDIVVQERSSRLSGILLGDKGLEPTYDPDYRKYQKMCKQIDQIFADSRHAVAAAAKEIAEEAAPEPERPTVCPGCGAPAGTGKFCEYCGTALG